MRTLGLLGLSALLCCWLVTPVRAGQVDSMDYVEAAMATLKAYVMDETMAPYEGPEIRQVEHDILDLRDPSLSTTIEERRQKLNDDIAALYAKDQWLGSHYIL